MLLMLRLSSTVGGRQLPQLMLMMLCKRGICRADAHDAGLGRRIGWQPPRLMLMMLGLCGA